MKFYGTLTPRQLEEHLMMLRRFEERAEPPWKDLWQAEILMAEGKPEEAVARLQTLAEHPDANLRGAAYKELGAIYEELDDEESALRAYEAAEALPARPFQATYRRILILMGRGSEEEVKAVLQHVAPDLAEDDLQLMEMLTSDFAALLQRSGRRTEAVQLVRDLLDRFPGRDQLHSLLQRLEET